jgi:DNA invertase Pin-like site-specific DNA recombinase
MAYSILCKHKVGFMRICYARVSTEEQNTSLQIDALTNAECQQIFEEKVSGKSKDRPELDVCLKVLREGDTLVVWRLDRLGRSLEHLVQIVRDLESRKIGFQSLTESIDTTNAGGKLVFHIFAALAEFERNLISERTKAGLKAGRARGRKGGRKAKLTNSDMRKAAAMLRDPLVTKTEVAKHFSVSRVTLNAALIREGFERAPINE